MRIKHLTQTLLFCSMFLMACGGNNTQTSNNTSETEKQETTGATSHTAPAAETGKVVNYLNAVESIDFDGAKYNLAWSHPPQQGVYYIQEYMPDGQIIDQYEDIFILDLYKDANSTVEGEVKEKTDWMKKRKASDPLSVYKVSQSPDNNEYIVDLIVSDGNTVEWNVIRYTEYKENGKRAGVRTFTMSKRGYEGMEVFVNKMMKRKPALMKEFYKLSFPEIKPSK